MTVVGCSYPHLGMFGLFLGGQQSACAGVHGSGVCAPAWESAWVMEAGARCGVTAGR